MMGSLFGPKTPMMHEPALNGDMYNSWPSYKRSMAISFAELRHLRKYIDDRDKSGFRDVSRTDANLKRPHRRKLEKEAKAYKRSDS